MTPKEAIETIKIAIAEVEWNYPINYAAAFEVAIEALEKQIAKEHHHTRVVEVKCKTRESVCPACLGVIITTENEYPKHCDWCGQAIDWSDGERKEND